ncbi:unnamed protein product, partial [Amoebophrya sp. A120]
QTHTDKNREQQEKLPKVEQEPAYFSATAHTTSFSERRKMWQEKTRKFRCTAEVVRNRTERMEDFRLQDGNKVFDAKNNHFFRIFLQTSITDPFELNDFYTKHVGGSARKLLEASLGRIMYGWKPDPSKVKSGPRGHMSILGGLPIPSLRFANIVLRQVLRKKTFGLGSSTPYGVNWDDGSAILQLNPKLGNVLVEEKSSPLGQQEEEESEALDDASGISSSDQASSSRLYKPADYDWYFDDVVLDNKDSSDSRTNTVVGTTTIGTNDRRNTRKTILEKVVERINLEQMASTTGSGSTGPGVQIPASGEEDVLDRKQELMVQLQASEKNQPSSTAASTKMIHDITSVVTHYTKQLFQTEIEREFQSRVNVYGRTSVTPGQYFTKIAAKLSGKLAQFLLRDLLKFDTTIDDGHPVHLPGKTTTSAIRPPLEKFLLSHSPASATSNATKTLSSTIQRHYLMREYSLHEELLAFFNDPENIVPVPWNGAYQLADGFLCGMMFENAEEFLYKNRGSTAKTKHYDYLALGRLDLLWLTPHVRVDDFRVVAELEDEESRSGSPETANRKRRTPSNFKLRTSLGRDDQVPALQGYRSSTPLFSANTRAPFTTAREQQPSSTSPAEKDFYRGQAPLDDETHPITRILKHLESSREVVDADENKEEDNKSDGAAGGPREAAVVPARGTSTDRKEKFLAFLLKQPAEPKWLYRARSLARLLSDLILYTRKLLQQGENNYPMKTQKDQLPDAEAVPPVAPVTLATVESDRYLHDVVHGTKDLTTGKQMVKLQVISEEQTGHGENNFDYPGAQERVDVYHDADRHRKKRLLVRKIKIYLDQALILKQMLFLKQEKKPSGCWVPFDQGDAMGLTDWYQICSRDYADILTFDRLYSFQEPRFHLFLQLAIYEVYNLELHLLNTLLYYRAPVYRFDWATTRACEADRTKEKLFARMLDPPLSFPDQQGIVGGGDAAGGAEADQENNEQANTSSTKLRILAETSSTEQGSSAEAGGLQLLSEASRGGPRQLPEDTTAAGETSTGQSEVDTTTSNASTASARREQQTSEESTRVVAKMQHPQQDLQENPSKSKCMFNSELSMYLRNSTSERMPDFDRGLFRRWRTLEALKWRRMEDEARRDVLFARGSQETGTFSNTQPLEQQKLRDTIQLSLTAATPLISGARYADEKVEVVMVNTDSHELDEHATEEGDGPAGRSPRSAERPYTHQETRVLPDDVVMGDEIETPTSTLSNETTTTGPTTPRAPPRGAGEQTTAQETKQDRLDVRAHQQRNNLALRYNRAWFSSSSVAAAGIIAPRTAPPPSTRPSDAKIQDHPNPPPQRTLTNHFTQSNFYGNSYNDLYHQCAVADVNAWRVQRQQNEQDVLIHPTCRGRYRELLLALISRSLQCRDGLQRYSIATSSADTASFLKNPRESDSTGKDDGVKQTPAVVNEQAEVPGSAAAPVVSARTAEKTFFPHQKPDVTNTFMTKNSFVRASASNYNLTPLEANLFYNACDLIPLPDLNLFAGKRYDNVCFIFSFTRLSCDEHFFRSVPSYEEEQEEINERENEKISQNVDKGEMDKNEQITTHSANRLLHEKKK